MTVFGHYDCTVCAEVTTLPPHLPHPPLSYIRETHYEAGKVTDLIISVSLISLLYLNILWMMFLYSLESSSCMCLFCAFLIQMLQTLRSLNYCFLLN